MTTATDLAPADARRRRLRRMTLGIFILLTLEVAGLLVVRMDAEKARFSTFLMAEATIAAVVCGALLLKLRRPPRA